MSDKNFKVKNGIDANGTITVSSFSDATSNLTINENVSTRRNLVLNPVFAVNDTTGWGSYFQSTNTIITDATAPYGTKVLQIEIPKDANPHGTIWLADESQQANIAYSVSAYVKGPAGVQGIFSGRPTLPDSSYLSEGSGALTFTFTGSWQRIYFTYTPSVAYKTGFQLTISPTQYSTTMNFYMHGIVVEYGSTTNLPYFDGSQNAYADKYRATTAWSGTANLSKSTVTYISQTANALEVKGNSSTTAKIDPYGTLTISASATPTSINGQYGNLTVRSTTLADSLNTAAYINTGYAPGVGLILRGYGSQAADLQQWQYSDGNTYARISPYGQLAIGDVNPSIYSNARISLNTVATSAVGLVIRGVSSQTANLQEWQDSAGTVLARITSTGTISGTNGLSATGGSITGINSQANSIGSAISGVNWAVTAGGATLIPIVAKAAASQTANLQEWQDSAGSVVSAISSGGALSINLTNISITGGSGTGALEVKRTIFSDTGSITNIGIIVRGRSGQTANLQEWQNSSQVVLARVSSAGAVVTSNAGVFGSQSNVSNAQLAVIANSLTNPTFVVKGVASGTGNLTEWQNSAGTTLASMSPIGKLTTTADALINGITLGWGGGQSYQNLAFGYSALLGNTTGALNMAMGYRALQANTTGWNNMALGADALVANTTGQNNTAVGAQSLYGNTNGGENVAIGNWALLGGNGAYNVAVGASSMNSNSSSTFNTAVGRLSLYSISYGAHNTAIGQQAGGSLTSGASNAILGSEALLLATTGSNNIAVGRDAGHSVVTGSANVFLGYQAGYSETGSNKLYISNSNTATPLIGGDFSAATLTLSANTTILSKTASTVGLIVKAISDQSTDIQQWKRSDDYLFASINQYGSFYTAGNLQVSVFAAFGSSTRGTEKVFILNDSAANAGLIVKGAASQTANLQEWQNSAGTASAYVTSGGSLKANSIRANTVSYLGVIGAVLTVATDIGIVVRGSASQTGNLQEWQDSAGAIKSFVRYDGFIRADASFQTPTIYSPTTGGTQVNLGTAWTYQINAAANTGIIVKGAASQTANLQEWQDSSGAVLSKIDKDGNITAADLTLSGNLTVNGTTTNLNSTNLVIEDKNIIIADVATPTDTTADGAGITIKGATDKTLTWVNSTKSFTTSDPLIIDGTNSTTVPLLVKVPTAQTTNSFEVQDSRGYSMFKVIAPAGGTAYNNGAIWIRPWGIGNVAAMGTDSSQGFYFVSPAASTINFGTGGGGKAFEIVVNNTFNRYKVEGKGTGVAPIFTTNGNDTDVNMHIYPKGAGKIGINTTTPTGYVHAVSSSSSTVGLIVEGASGQTSTNIFEVQRAGGSDPSFAVSHNYIGLNRNTTAAASLSVYGSNSGAVPLYVVARASQSVSLQEWQNSSGTVLAAINPVGQFFTGLTPHYATVSTTTDASGDGSTATITTTSAHNIAVGDFILVSGITPVGYNGTYLVTAVPTSTQISYANTTTGSQTVAGSILMSAQASITARSNTSVGLTVKAGANASAQTWQNSSGAQVARVDNTGNIVVADVIANNLNAPFGYALIGTSYSRFSTAMISAKSTTAASQGIIVRGAASQTADLQQWQNSAGSILGYINSGGHLNINELNGAAGFQYGNSFGVLQTKRGIIALAGVSNNVAISIFGADSPTADLMTWGKSNGDIIGGITANAGIYTYLQSASTVGLIVKGAASQSANLQEWQASDATVLSRIDNNGSFITKNGLATGSLSFAGITYNGLSNPTGITSVPTLVVKAIGSQSANIQEWHNSAGTTIGVISVGGDLIIPGSRVAIGQASVAAATMFISTAAGASFTPIVSRGAASQTADLQQWQNSAGTVITRIDSSGQNIWTYSIRPQVTPTSGSFIQLDSNQVRITQQTAGAVAFIVKGAASQTANLQEWQNSAGTVLANVDPSGHISTSGFVALGVNAGIVVGGSYVIRNNYGSNNSINIGNSVSQQTAAQVQVTNSAAGIVGLIVKGAASQSANLQEWQDSAGTVLSGINPAGQIFAGTTASINSSNTTAITSAAYTSATVAVFTYGGTSLVQEGQRVKVAGVTGGTYNGTWTVTGVTSTTFTVLGSGFTDVAGTGGTFTLSAVGSFVAGTAAITPIVVRAAASQTANLTQWQDSSGNVLTRVYADGTLVWGSGGSALQNSSGRLIVNPSLATSIAVTVKGAVSQTANLQEWQNSAGQVRAKIDSYGGFSSLATATISNDLNGNGTSLVVQTKDAGGIPIVVKGFTSQTADLQQWQNTGGTVLALVDAYGRLGINTTSLANSTGGYSMVSIYNNNTVNTNLVIKSYPSQTATLTEWQNSSGTTLAKIDVLGNFTATSKSFDIEHPTKENMRLRYGSLEGPENGVYVRGTIESNIIELPDYWTGLVHEDSITVSLTPVGSAQNIYVEKIENNKIYIGGNLEKAFFTVYGERKDIDKLTVEY